ncbi:MAG: hypothetical protein RML99_07405 [Anaerolineae bacterium]|nr:hypothetical protein [Anaerolineae bacterium]
MFKTKTFLKHAAACVMAFAVAGQAAAGTPSVFPRQTANRVVEEAGGFSYVPPTGWRVEATNLSEFKVLFGRSDGSGFTPNVNFNVSQSDAALDEFKALAIQELEAGISGFALLSESTLVTERGNDVVKLVCNSTLQRRSLRQIFYLVDFGPRKLVVTYTRLRNSQQQNDAAVEAMIKTIESLDDTSASAGKYHVEAGGGFAYVPPEGWQLKDEPGADFKVLAVRRAGDAAESAVAFFTTNDIPALDADFRRSYRTELPNRLRGFRGDLRNIRAVRDEGFTTEQGYPGAKFVLDATYSGVRAQIILYLVDIGSTTVAALYMRPRTGSLEDDQAIEAMINTLAPAEAIEGATDAKGTGTRRHYERSGNFSYDLPEGWSLKQPDELPASVNAEFAALFGPASGNITPNVLFFEDTLSGTFSDYLEAAVQSIRDNGGRNVSSPEKLRTDAGLEYARILATRMDGGQRLQQAYYIFPERKRVIFAIYTRLAQGRQSQLDETVETVMQSFRFGR